VVTFDPGKHRRPEPETQAPAGMPISQAGLLRPPVDVPGGPATDDGTTWAPEYGRMPKRRDMAGAARRAVNQRPLLTDPDRPPSAAGPRPQWAAPPSLLHPDHPSAPVPRVRVPLAPGAGRAGPGPARSQAAEQDAAAIRQEAVAIRAAAEQEAAQLRAVILALSEQLSQMAAYAMENLGSPRGTPAAPAGAATAALRAVPPVAFPAGPAARPARPVTRPARPATRHARPASRPTRPASRHARPVTKPAKSTTRPTTGMQGRQARAARKVVALLAAMVTVGVVSGAAELALHGGPFFIFRANGAGASETGPVEDQGPGQPDAPGAHHAPAPPKHAK
jgi:hypothetical protein